MCAAFRAAHTLKGICLNLGFSCLGKAASELAEYLRGRGDTVGYDAPVADYDYIVNTAPSRIISNEKLLTLKNGAEIIDIASAPYGIDHDFAEKNGIRHGIYPCLPVRYKSAAAGQAIVNLVRREYD